MKFTPTQNRTIEPLNNQLTQIEEDMLNAGEWPKNKPIPVQRFEGEFYRATLHYDKATNEWVLRRESKTTGDVIETTSPRRSELIAQWAFVVAETTLEDVETERQAKEHAEMLAEEGGEAVDEFLNNYKEGEEYREMKKYLPGGELDRRYRRAWMFNLLQTYIEDHNMAFTANSLAVAHNNLLDENDEYWGYKVAADQEKLRQEKERIAAEQEAALEAERQTIAEAPTPFANSTRVRNPVEGVPSRGIYAPTPTTLEMLKRRIQREKTPKN